MKRKNFNKNHKLLLPSCVLAHKTGNVFSKESTERLLIWNAFLRFHKGFNLIRSKTTDPFIYETDDKKNRIFAPTVLILDDKDVELFEAILENSSRRELKVLSATKPKDAIKILKEQPVGVMILDMNLGATPDGKMISGIESIPKFLSIRPSLKIVVATGEGTEEAKKRALDLGAMSFAKKDDGFIQIANQIDNAIDAYQSSLTNLIRETNVPKPTIVSQFVGMSAAAEQITTKIDALCRVKLPILITGESGTGKTTLAETIHKKRNSYLGRKDSPFIKVTCNNITENDPESELFGVAKGSFTGVDGKQGMIELAHNGTLFLDEVADLPEVTQGKLLEVLQSGTFRRRGGPKTVLHSDFDLITATNKNLEELVAQKKFREDLYYRIKLFDVHMPSFKERRDDIPEIIRRTLPLRNKEAGTNFNFDDIPNSFIEFLKNNPPSGNFRGLEAIMQYLLVLCPRDSKTGRPDLKRWEEVPEICRSGSLDQVKLQSKQGPISWKEFIHRGVSFHDDPDFPGLTEARSVLDALLFKSTAAANKKAGDVARALGVHHTRIARMREKTEQILGKFRGSPGEEGVTLQ